MKTKREWLDTLSSFVQKAERLILGVGAVALVLWLIDPVRDWLVANRLMDIERVVGLCALSILFSLRAIERLNTRVDRFVASEEESIILDGTAKVYEAVDDVIERCCDSPRPRSNEGRRQLDILGITLFSAWDHLQPLLKKPTFRDWDVTFACMQADYAKAQASVPPEWSEPLPARLRDITDFVKKSKADLDKRNVRVRLFVFEHIPAIHGFRIEQEEVFLSYIHWEGQDLAKPFQFYEHFAAGNRSMRATQYRELFANWLERSHASGAIASN